MERIDQELLMPPNTEALLVWLNRKYPRPLYHSDPERSEASVKDQFLIDTGKRQLVEELSRFWKDQNTQR